MVLLHQINPDEPYNSVENLNAQRHHAHQVCGIVAHTKDKGVASVAIRSLAIAAYVLHDPKEQAEVVSLFKRISAESGWRINRIYMELQQAWGRDIKGMAGDLLSGTASTTTSASPSTIPPSSIDLPPPTNMLTHGYGCPSSQRARLASESKTDSLAFNCTLSHSVPAGQDASASSAAPSLSSGVRSITSALGGNPSFCRYPSYQGQNDASLVLGAEDLVSTGATATGPTACSIHSSPSISSLVPYRPPQMANPLVHADFSLPDHPYKAFYRPPNDSAQLS